MNYKKLMNPKVLELQPSGIRKFFDLVNEMPDAISLGVGEPDFDTPFEIREEAVRTIRKGFTQYTPNKGMPALLKNISKYLWQRFDLKYCDKTEILITVGASEAIDLTMRTFLQQDDEVLIPAPCYVSYAPCAQLAGAKPVALPLNAQNGFKLTPDILERAITKKSKLLILPYPCNPTGAIMEREYLEQIAKIVTKHNLIVISDEIYAELTYGCRHVSIAEIEGMKQRTVLISGFSKAFAMTGWRLGYACAPEPIISQMCKIHQFAIMCAPTMSQYAAIAALNQGFEDGFCDVSDMREQYDLRRSYLVSQFNEMGLYCFEPKGAFYVFPSLKAIGLNGEEFAQRLLLSQKVAVIPGSAFGDSSQDFIRCSYAYSLNDLQEAVRRIKMFLRELKKP